MAVDIGCEAIERNTNLPGERTMITKDNPASEDGTITTIEVYAPTGQDLTGFRVGTFYVTNGNTLKCRDSEAIPGTIVGGSKVEKAVIIAVVAGDYIGCYVSSAEGAVQRNDSGFGGVWYTSGEYIDPDDEATYTLLADDALSLGGYITPVVIPTPVADGDLIGIPVIRKS